MKDAYCNACGAKFPEPLKYPRKCAGCGLELWANPIPVSVALVPVVSDGRTGLLVVRRGIEPRTGFLTLPGGFLEDHETWQQGGAREVFGESGVKIDPATLECLWFTSTEPRPNRVLLFSVAAPLTRLEPFVPNHESPERGVVFGPDGLAEIFAFPLHMQAALKYFASRGVKGPHDYRIL